MRFERLAVGDMIKARTKGHSLWEEVTEVKDGIVYFSPISAAAGGGGTPARARSSVTGARPDGAPAAGTMTTRARPVPREQLSLPEVHE